MMAVLAVCFQAIGGSAEGEARLSVRGIARLVERAYPQIECNVARCHRYLSARHEGRRERRPPHRRGSRARPDVGAGRARAASSYQAPGRGRRSCSAQSERTQGEEEGFLGLSRRSTWAREANTVDGTGGGRVASIGSPCRQPTHGPRSVKSTCQLKSPRRPIRYGAAEKSRSRPRARTFGSRETVPVFSRT